MRLWNSLKSSEKFKLRKIITIDNILQVFPIVTIISIFLKDNIFFGFVFTYYEENFGAMFAVHLAFIALIIAPSFLFKGKKQKKYCIVVNVLYSILLISDLWCYRASGNFWGIEYLYFKDLFNPFQRSLINPRWFDFILIIDLILIIAFMIYRKVKNVEIKQKNHNRSFVKYISITVISIVIILIGANNIEVSDLTNNGHNMFKNDWSPSTTLRNLTPIGYHSFEIVDTLKKVNRTKSQGEIEEVDEWLADNDEKLPDNKYKGTLKGKNLIFLQIESFENFVIGKEVYGQEITPNLNRLIKKSYYFDNIIQQNNGGNSIDCDMMVNTSVFPLGKGITFINEPQVKYNSLPLVLQKEGYYTVSTHAENSDDWNWSEAHNAGLKFQEKWDKHEYNMDEYVGFGLSDRSFLSQFADKISKLQDPFYAILPTLSSHGPFDIADEYRELSLPKEIDENYLGGYFQSLHYTDKQIANFLDKLETLGLMDNSVVVIYGDHAGVHKYYNESIQNLNLEGDWWREYDQRIPLIIYSKGITGQTFDVYGGQVDIMPTISYLLGVNDESYRGKVMGRILVNTKRNATITKGNKIFGEPDSQEEKEHLLKSYDIGEKIILNDYFDK